MHRQQKQKGGKLDNIKIKNFHASKDTINRLKDKQSMGWEKIFANDIPDKILICRIYKEPHIYKVRWFSFLKLDFCFLTVDWWSQYDTAYVYHISYIYVIYMFHTCDDIMH